MILWYLWRRGLLARADATKTGFFLGLGTGPLDLSRRFPLVASVNWVRAMLQPSYARAVASWLAYRADLYDAHQG